MRKIPTPNPSDGPAFLPAFSYMLGRMYAKRVFSLGHLQIRLLPFVLAVWGGLLTFAALTLDRAASALFILGSIAAVPMVPYSWHLGVYFGRLLGLRQRLGFWQTVGLGFPLMMLFTIILMKWVKR